MQVGMIQNQPFLGKIKETKKGNQYETSNTGKIATPLIAIAKIGANVLFTKAVGPTDFKLTDLNKAFEKNKKVFYAGGGIIAAVTIGASLIVGAIYDAVINHTRRKDADKFAETGKVSGKSDIGKKILGAIGLVVGGFSLAKVILNEELLAEVNKMKNPKLYKFSLIPIFTIAGIINGAVYDHGVNKFRDQLSYKADIAARNKAKLDAEIDTKIEEKIKAQTQNTTKVKAEKAAA